MFSNDIPVDNLDQAFVLQLPDSSPKARLAAAVGSARRPEPLFSSPKREAVRNLGLMGDLAGFRVNKAIVSPKAEQAEYCSLLSVGQSQGAGQTFPDMVKSSQEQAG